MAVIKCDCFFRSTSTPALSRAVQGWRPWLAYPGRGLRYAGTPSDAKWTTSLAASALIVECVVHSRVEAGEVGKLGWYRNAILLGDALGYGGGPAALDNLRPIVGGKGCLLVSREVRVHGRGNVLADLFLAGAHGISLCCEGGRVGRARSRTYRAMRRL